MSFLTKCYQADDLIFLKFQSNIDVESFDISNFSLNNGTVLSVTGSGDEATLTFQQSSRPIVLTCNVTDLNSNPQTDTRIVAREMNYKLFSNRQDLLDFYQSVNLNVNLDGKIYYDAADCNLYYDTMGEDLASDLSGNLLVYIIDFEEFIESQDCSSGVVTGWNQIDFPSEE